MESAAMYSLNQCIARAYLSGYLVIRMAKKAQRGFMMQASHSSLDMPVGNLPTISGVLTDRPVFVID